MTVKLVVLYTRPDDCDAFDRHYLGTHIPLSNKLPGVQRVETGRLVSALDGGEQTFYRVTELYFADQTALEAAVGPAEGESGGSRLPADRAARVEDVHGGARLTAFRPRGRLSLRRYGRR
ncbi:MAG TPA: EthD family reductase [Streptosporangiaceae bacterium]|nr:EthD family reductase [Streptosporangiaceae bacterium]